MSENDDLTAAIKNIVGWAELLLDETAGPLNDTQQHDVKVILKTASQELSILAQASGVLSRMRAGLEYSSISHDIRAPFNGFLGYSKMMLDHPEIYGVPLNEAQADYLTKIHDTAHQLLEALNEIFDYASIKAGHIHHEPAAFDLLALLLQLTHDFSPGVMAMLPGALPLGFGDEYRTRQTVVNIIRWFKQASPESVVRLQARPAEDMIEITVSVSGELIPAVNPDDLFDPETGLTLPAARALVEVQGGALQVESAPGLLAFYVSIPIQAGA